MKELHPEFTVLETEHLRNVFHQALDQGSDAGNTLWTPDSQGIVFVSLTNCESSVYFYDLKQRALSPLLAQDPACIELLSVNESAQIALLKSTQLPVSKTYWYLDPYTKTLLPIAPTPE
jgi:hypothetical protein